MTTRTTLQTVLESKLEEKFVLAVRKTLRGKTIKIIPVEKGAPDRLVLLPGGEIHLVELKTDDGVLSPKQRHWHSQAALLGTVVHIIWGETGLADWVSARRAN